VLLLAYFFVCANFITQTLFQNLQLRENTLDLIIRDVREIEDLHFEDLGREEVDTVGQLQMEDYPEDHT
jgi:hypothetical protein